MAHSRRSRIMPLLTEHGTKLHDAAEQTYGARHAWASDEPMKTTCGLIACPAKYSAITALRRCRRCFPLGRPS